MKGASLLIHLLLTALSLSPALAKADIYHYIDDDGVPCFTDVPTTSEAVVIMREGTRHRSDGRKRIPVHLSATGIGKKVDGDWNLTSREAADFTLPIKGRVTSLSGMRHDPIDGSMRMHNGVDIAAPSGTPIKPAMPGKVLFSGTRPGYGNMIILEHNDGTITVYAHNSANVKQEGEYADSGDTIALIGSTGRSTGPHLHFEAWREGINITSSFTGLETADPRGTGNDTIRMSISADGSLLFTNMN